MTPATAAATSKTIHRADIAPRERYAAIFAAFDALDVGDAIEIVNGLDPDALYFEFQTRAPGYFSWCYLQQGPLWRVSIRKLARSHSGGRCGACGGGA